MNAIETHNMEKPEPLLFLCIKQKTGFIFLLFIFFLCSHIYPDPVILEHDKIYQVGRYLRIIEDPGKELTIKDVSSPQMDDYFQASDQQIPNYAYSKSAFWIKIIIINRIRNNGTFYFSFNHPTLDYIDCYLPVKNGSSSAEWMVKQAGDCRLFSSREVKHRNHVFIVPIDFNEEITLYFRVLSDSTITFPCEIASREAFHTQDRIYQLDFGVFYGILVILILYHTVLSVYLKDVIYIIYSLYILFTGLLLFTLNGFIAEYFSFAGTWLLNRMSSLAGALSLITAILFARFFLELKDRAPILDKTVLILLSGAVFAGVFSFFPDYSLSITLLNFVTICTGIIAIIIGLTLWKQGFQPARYWFLAFTFMALGMILYGLRNVTFLIHIIPNNSITSNGIQFGFLLQILFLSLGLGNRINLIRRQKLLAQELVIKNLNEINTMKDSFLEKIERLNINLEKKVEARTRELSQANKKLSELDTLKNDFIANITHDFRSPLMIILNTTELLLSGVKENRIKLKKKLENIFEAGTKLKNTIDKLLDLARLDATGIKLHISKIDIKSLLAGLVDFYQSSIISSSINIIVAFPSAPIENFYSDREKLEQILDNIISNALKYVDIKTGIITLELKVFTTILRIIVSDNGIGIPPEKLDIIFERFVQVEGGGNSKIKGTGIGLAFSRQLTELLHGRIWAESGGIHHGTSFFIELPLEKDVFHKDEFTQTDDKAQYISRRDNTSLLLKKEIQRKMEMNDCAVILPEINQESEYDIKKAVILIIDDNKQIIEIEMEYLQNAGYKNFILAFDGNEGIEAAYTYHPDIILCDYTMPMLNGNEIHDKLCTNPDFKTIPFIFISAILDKNIIIERKRKGAVAYIVKPIDREDFLLTLELHLKKYFELKKSQQQAVSDELTGLHNHNKIISIMQDKILGRKLANISVVFFDIDHFKSFNDLYGHQIGDKVLARIGKIIKSSIRREDIPGRYGGEEFLIILPDTDIDKAKVVAEKVKNAIEEEIIEYKNEKLTITASFGISSLYEYEEYICKMTGLGSFQSLTAIQANKEKDGWLTIDQYKITIAGLLIKMADIAMYSAKKTICRSCGFGSVREAVFQDRVCPECGSGGIDTGRSKIKVFDESFEK
ncbi:MAG: diguanylate cyclase [Spirochaetales bacterium]|nr:diguanylate cyclase [Spirochaetales bacterium]